MISRDPDLSELILSGRRFSAIYADPAWTFRVYSEKGKARSAERHYQTMSLQEIKDLPVAQLAADDCVLFLWCVCPQLHEAMEVIAAWGFEYKTVAFNWIKTAKTSTRLHWGMGYWTRANSELCLLASKGSPKRRNKDVHQVIISPVQQHSRKPEETRTRIESLVDGPYLELFARESKDGWHAWGNQARAPIADFLGPNDA
jgi:N6-adenosine-specific RNA methylase IME4